MRICAAQTRPVKGDIAANLEQHTKLIRLAVSHAADMIIFPELSLTGYEPGLASNLAGNKDDSRFDVLQQFSDEHRIIIGAGMPIKSESGILIGMILFQARQPRIVYAKQYLHPDEYPYFVAGRDTVCIKKDDHVISFAICYELSVPEHAAAAGKSSADIYLVSVAKTAGGMVKAAETLADTARQYSMTVLLSNCVGHCDNFASAGRSSVWNDRGEWIGGLNETDQGIVIFDTLTGELITKIV